MYSPHVLTTVEAGNLGKSDHEQLAYASEHHRALVTHNRVDFERLADAYFTNGQTHGGIIIAVRRHPRELADRRRQLLDQFTADETDNQLIYL